MIDATEAALVQAGVPAERVHTERFTTGAPRSAAPAKRDAASDTAPTIALTIVVDGKSHELALRAGEHVLDAALNVGLDIPYSCKAGVCCTCRAKVLQGTVQMTKNFTLEDSEVAQGFALSCQACATSPALTVSFDER